MSNLLSELDAVVGQLRSYDDKSVAGVRLSTLSESAVRLLRTHHAEIAADAKDAARYRWLRERNALLCDEGEEPPFNLCVTDDQPDGDNWVGSDLDSVLDAAMSAREGQ